MAGGAPDARKKETNTPRNNHAITNQVGIEPSLAKFPAQIQGVCVVN